MITEKSLLVKEDKKVLLIEGKKSTVTGYLAIMERYIRIEV
jgi:hypothetical protein